MVHYGIADLHLRANIYDPPQHPLIIDRNKMPLNDLYFKNQLEKLSAIRPVTVKKMFGGAGLYCQDAFFAILDDDRTYFKVDTESEPLYLAEKMPGWGETKDGTFRYREVPACILSNSVDLGIWIDAAVKAAKGSPKKRR